jgi:hypothetical protein
MMRRVALPVLLAAAVLAAGGCGKKEEPKADAATEQKEALERAKHGAFGTQVKALETAKGIEADVNKKAQENLEKADEMSK